MTNYIKRKWIFICGLIVILSFVGSNIGYGQSSSYKLQALYMYSFAKYILWEKDTTKFIIGVVGESGITEELKIGAKERKVGGKPVEIKVFDNLSEAHLCHIIYLPKDYSKILPHLILLLQEKSVLVISENDLAKKGAGISFFLVGNRLKFKINQEVLEQSGLKVSKGLLDLAVLI